MKNSPSIFLKKLGIYALIVVCVTVGFPQHTHAITCDPGAASNITFTDIGGGVCRGFITSGTSLTLPSDWNNSDNTIEAIGAGGNGGGSVGGGGGGGGAYAKITNFSGSGSIALQIGAHGGTTGSGITKTANTYFKDASTLVAAGGATQAFGGAAGGTVANSVGATKYAGGSGGSDAGSSGGGGGGAAGPNGAGANGTAGTGSNGGNGGNAGNGSGGTGGSGSTGAANASPGNNGTEWDATHGSGGGGGGGSSTVGSRGGAGGSYGGAGGGTGNTNNTALGSDGLIVVTYTPTGGASAPTVTTNSAQTFTPTSATVFGSITATGGENSTARGFAISTNSGLSTGVSTTTESGSFSTGSFSYSSTTLTANQTYYFRAYSTNSAGTGYGSILSFSTGNDTPARKMRLFEGYSIKLISGRIIVNQ